MALDPVAVALKFGFLAVLYLFLLWMARSALKDLRRDGSETVGPSYDEATGMHHATAGLSVDGHGGVPKLRVANAAGLTDQPTTQTFRDVTFDNPFYDYIERVASRGIVSGYTCGAPGEPCDTQNRPYFRQNNDAPRGQIAKIVYGAVTAGGPCGP